MPKRLDIKKIMVIGSGPIVIGQAAEFDYAGTQACLTLKAEGYEVVLVNSNPATIMTDRNMADRVYMEPLTIEYVSKIIRKERPQAILPGIGGQTGLNLVMELSKKGVLDECQVEVLGTSLESIELAEDRELFKALCERIGEPTIESAIGHTVEEIMEIASQIGYPIILRPAFTLGGTGGGFVYDEASCRLLAASALMASPVQQVLVEKSITGYKEIEYEVIRDHLDTAIIVCNMENVDPVGVHTGDSMVVAPTMTLTSQEANMLKEASIGIIRALKIEGGCNVQFALDPVSKQYYVIEVNPRVSRSSALASKATGYPIARVSTLIAIGYHLDEIKLSSTYACFEPTIDYIVTKLARFPFDKFKDANRTLSTQMKATGEIMAIGRSFEQSFHKALRSLENGYLDFNDYEPTTDLKQILQSIAVPDDLRLYKIAYLLKQGVLVETICHLTKISAYFIRKIKDMVMFESQLVLDYDVIKKAKQMGYSDCQIAKKLNVDEASIRAYRKQVGIIPTFKMIDTCSNEYDAYVPYFYSSYDDQQDSIVSNKPSILVIGSGPIRIGQGVEFDYSTVHCIQTIQSMGYEAIVINNNPETVSTDYTMSDKLYFEPLTYEDVMNVIEFEQPIGVIIQLGGQTALNLGSRLTKAGVPILGTSYEQIERAENRDYFEKLLASIDVKQPMGKAITHVHQAIEVAQSIGYPVLVRPSFVLGGQSMRIVHDDQSLLEYVQNVAAISDEQPVLIDRYIKGKEVEVDAVCDGHQVVIPGIMEHIEKTGVHSGDSISVYPSFSLSYEVIAQITTITEKIGRALQIIGLYNIQFIVTPEEEVYIIEVNPRASRSVPFISKVTDVHLSVLATKVMLGKSLQELGYMSVLQPIQSAYYFVKTPSFSFNKIHGVDTSLGPEMKSTGEAIGYDRLFNKALYKGLQASGMQIKEYGTVFFTVANEDKEEVLSIAKRFYDLGFNLVATKNTANFLKQNQLKVKTLPKISEGSRDILEWIEKGYIKYIVNTQSSDKHSTRDGYTIRTHAAMNNITTFTSLDTVRVLLSVLEDRSINVSTMNDLN